MRAVLWLGGMGACVLALLGSWTMDSGAADKPDRVLRHVVLYKFKADLKAEQVQEVVDAFSALPKKVESIIGFERGTNVSREQKSEGFTHCFMVTFADEQGRDAYLVSPAHEAYVKVVRDRREKVIVFDYWANP
jgi:stress responsive alpha/beta barrel protein